MQNVTCVCGSPMSFFETEQYRKCGGCHQEEENQKAEQKSAQAKRQEEERILQEKLKKEAKIANQKAIHEERLQKIVGKTIERVAIKEWTDAGGVEPQLVELLFTDGTRIEFSQEEFADGCRGSYDYYPYLEVIYE